MTQTQSYKAWFEKYRPTSIEDVVLPNETIKQSIDIFYNQEFIRGNVLSYGPPGVGKTTLSEVLIHKIIKDRHDIFILGRKVDEVDNLKRWLQQQAVHSNQKIVKIEEMDRLSKQAQLVLKDGLMEKYQHNTAFLATTNNPEKIDPALLTRFNTKINFSHLPIEGVSQRLEHILKTEGVQYTPEALKKYIESYGQRGLRDLINNLELASISGTFQPESLESFSGVSESETLIIQYIIYLVKYLESKDSKGIQEIIMNPRSDQQFFTYYEYMLKIFKSDLSINFDLIYGELTGSDLDLTAVNIVNDFWQDLELKRFKSTHTVSMMNSLMINVLEQKGKS